MEKTFNNFSIGLFIWQLLALIAVVLVFLLLLKTYKKISKYLDLKIKLLEKKIESGED